MTVMQSVTSLQSKCLLVATLALDEVYIYALPEMQILFGYSSVTSACCCLYGVHFHLRYWPCV